MQQHCINDEMDDIRDFWDLSPFFNASSVVKIPPKEGGGFVPGGTNNVATSTRLVSAE